MTLANFFQKDALYAEAARHLESAIRSRAEFPAQANGRFVKLQDRSGQIQLMLKRDRLTEPVYADFKKWDLGDIVAARGDHARRRLRPDS